MKTLLKDRVLWHDGSITFTPDQLLNYVMDGGVVDDKITVTKLNTDIEKFNKFNPNIKVTTKDSLNELDKTWNLPDDFKNINIKQYVFKKLLEMIETPKGKELSEEDVQDRVERVEEELNLYTSRGMMDILKTSIYIVDTFRKNNVVWGTGRGSSCSSYILYLIGLHSVDSVKYDLELNEFFK